MSAVICRIALAASPVQSRQRGGTPPPAQITPHGDRGPRPGARDPPYVRQRPFGLGPGGDVQIRMIGAAADARSCMTDSV
jgi:hypothetical protein